MCTQMLLPGSQLQNGTLIAATALDLIYLLFYLLFTERLFYITVGH